MLAQIQATRIGTLDPADLDKVKIRVAQKNGYERVEGNLYVKQGWLTRFVDFSSKGRHNQNAARAYYESSHAVTAAALRVQHQLNHDPQVSQDNKCVWKAFRKSRYLQSRAKRQDHVRYREDLQSTNKNKISRVFARASHIFTGMCEMTSAPTGFTFKALRNLFFQGVEENGLTNMAVTGVASLGIGIASVATLDAMRNPSKQAGLAENAASALISFATISAAGGGLSALCTGVAALTAPDIELNDKRQKVLEDNLATTLGKINDLVLALKDTPDGLQQLARALNKKIPAKHRETLKTGQKHALPTLLKELADALEPSTSAEAKSRNLQKAIDVVGAYMNSVPPIDMDTATVFERHAYRQKVRDLEKHFMALAGMVEHIKTTSKVAQEPIKKDARTWLEDDAKNTNRKILKALEKPAALIDGAFGTQLVKRLNAWSDVKYAEIRNAKLKNPADAQKNSTHSEYMIANIHQYGPITQRLIRAALFIHAVNYHYVLAVNAQSSRVYGNLTKAADELVSTNHACRLGHAGVGRFLGGASVSAMYTFGIGGIEQVAGTAAATTVNLGAANMMIYNTGTMMTGVGLLSAGAMLLAKLAVHCEGWRGNVAAQAPLANTGAKTIHL